MLGLSNRLLAIVLCMANSFCLPACRMRMTAPNEEDFSLAKSTPECPSGIFRVQCADGHWEFQSLAAIEDDRVCPVLQIKVKRDTTLRAIDLKPNQIPPKAKVDCRLSRGISLRALSVSSVQIDQTRRLVLMDLLNACALQAGDIDASAIELKVDQYTLSAHESFPLDFCQTDGQIFFPHLSKNSQFDKVPPWGRCKGRYKESHCVDRKEIPLCGPGNGASDKGGTD